MSDGYPSAPKPDKIPPVPKKMPIKRLLARSFVAEPRRFMCAVCKLEYISEPAITQEDRIAEFEQVHQQPYIPDQVSSVCDTCYPKVIAWAREQGLLP